MKGLRRIWIDAGTGHVLAGCPACPSWRELRADRPAGLLAGADHLERCHGSVDAARELRRRARHAGES